MKYYETCKGLSRNKVKIIYESSEPGKGSKKSLKYLAIKLSSSPLL